MAAEHLYAHVFNPVHKALCDVRVFIINITNVDKSTQKEAFKAYKLDTFVYIGD